MKFLELNIQNFLVLTEARISLADRGLVLVQGVNSADSSADSNGSGKSSIADALCWAIYGTTARGETGDAVVNNKVGKETRVEVRILDDMTTYRIVRHRKHKTGKNALHVFMDDGFGEKDLTKGTDKLTQEVVDKIIGASLDVFTGSIYAGQERMPDLPSMTDKMLKLLIEEASGINALEEAYKTARENARIAKIDLDAAVREKEVHEQRVAHYRATLQTTVASEQQWEQHRKGQITALADRVSNQLVPQAKQLEAEAPKSEIDRLTAEIAAVDARISAVSDEQNQLQRLDHEVKRTMRSANASAAEKKIRAANIENLWKQLAAVDHKVGCPCDSCGRPITAAELAATKQKLVSDLADAQTVYDRISTEAHGAETAYNAAVAAYETYQRGMTDVSREAAQRAALEAQRASLMQKETQRQQVIAQARNDMATIERLKAETSPFQSQITNLQKLIDDAQKGVADASGLIAVRQDKYDLEMEVVRVFSPAGVRARVLDEVTPYLNGQTSKYLAILSDGNITAEWSTLSTTAKGELRERFAIDVSSGISSKTFKGLSGGEKRKVRVATALALQDLVATRASKPIDLFIGDEIDHALDASGLERLMVILDEKARERGTVMVISHSDLKDEIKQVLTVERTASGATKIHETAA